MSVDMPGSESGGQQPSKDEKLFALLCHLLGLVIALIIWLIKKEEMPFVDDQGKEAVNFQISVAIALVGLIIVSTILSFVLGMIGLGALAVILGFVFSLAYFAICVGVFVLVIMAAIKANEGVAYRYPINLRLIK